MADRQEVVQYRGQILPLLRASGQSLGIRHFNGESRWPLQVVVYSEQGRSVGLVVDRIADIVEGTVEVAAANAGTNDCSPRL